METLKNHPLVQYNMRPQIIVLLLAGMLLLTACVQSGQPSSSNQSSNQSLNNSQNNIPADSGQGEQAAPSLKTVDEAGVKLELKSSGYCKALAPQDWAFVTNAEATGADLFSPDMKMHAGWGITPVYAYMYPTVSDFLNAWMPLAGYSAFTPGAPQAAGYGFFQQEFTSTGRKGILFYKIYEIDPTAYIVSVYLASADENAWNSQGALPAYAAVSIRCVSQLRPSTSNVDLPSSNPSKSSDNPDIDLSEKWSEAILSYENVHSPTTGEHYQAPLSAYNPTGPEGAGYYRTIPNGYEKLEKGFGQY